MQHGSTSGSIESRRAISLQIAGLAAAFPSRASDSLKEIAATSIERFGFAGEIAEAVAQLIASREATTFPAVAEILKRCREVRAEQQHSQGDGAWCRSAEELNDLAIRRLRYREERVDDANVERELALMRDLGWHEPGDAGAAVFN